MIRSLPLAVLTPPASTRSLSCSSLLFLLPKMNVMGLVLLDQLARDEPLAGAPDEIHLSVCRAQRQSRLEDQEHAAIEKKEGADQTHRHRNPGAASAEKRNYTDGHTRRHEHSDRKIESRQRALQQTRAASQFIRSEERRVGKECRSG